MLKDTQIFKRMTSESPTFFKKITKFGLILGAVGAVLVAAPVALPAAIVTVGGYMVTIGLVAAGVAKTAVSDTKVLE